jgi:hypothetical protein
MGSSALSETCAKEEKMNPDYNLAFSMWLKDYHKELAAVKQRLEDKKKDADFLDWFQRNVFNE